MSESTATPVPRGPWLFHPAIDLLVGCGLLAVPLGALSWWASTAHASALVIGAAVLSIVINGPHYAATIVRALHHDGRSRRVLLVASVVALMVAVAAHLSPILLAALFTAYLTWSPWHYATQNHGVGVVLLARAGGPTATTTERRLLKGAHVVAAVAAVIAIHTGLSEAFLRRIGFSSGVALSAAVACTAIALVVGGGVLWRLRRRGAPLAGVMAAGLLLLTSLAWFTLPALIGHGATTSYVSGAAALLHCAQYLWLASFVEGRLAFVRRGRFDALAWAATLVALGVALFTLGPWVVSIACGYDLIVSLLIVQSVVNLHHFVVDAFIWKLRDPAMAAPLFSGRELAPARRELVSNTRAILATVVVTALLMVAVLDVAQLAGTRVDADDTWQARAASLNDHDSRVWVQQAQLAVASNDADAARSHLGRAVALSPHNADAQRALLRLHAVTGHLEEAWARKDAAPPGILDDLGSVLLFADVALRLERFDDAISLGRRAIAQSTPTPGSPNAIEARRIVGMALLAKDQAGEAVGVLRTALDDGEALVAGDAVRQGHLLEVATALAQAHVAVSQWDPALLLFERALDGATKADRADVAADALLGQAQVLLRRDDARQALLHVQRALRVGLAAPEIVDPARMAHGWLDYGGLLAASEAPMRARFTCAVKARQLAERMRPGVRQDKLLSFIAEATRFVEEVLPAADAEAVRSDVDTAAKEALALGYPDGDTDDEE